MQSTCEWTVQRSPHLTSTSSISNAKAPTGPSATNASPAMISGVAVGKSSRRSSTCVHSPGATNVTVGGGPAGSALLISITEYCRPSPRVRKRIASRPEKSTGCMGCSPGIQITPAHGKATPGAISPVTASAPSRTATSALEAPPVSWSVVTSHAPKLASKPSSKSATRVSAGARAISA